MRVQGWVLVEYVVIRHNDKYYGVARGGLLEVPNKRNYTCLRRDKRPRKACSGCAEGLGCCAFQAEAFLLSPFTTAFVDAVAPDCGLYSTKAVLGSLVLIDPSWSDKMRASALRLGTN